MKTSHKTFAVALAAAFLMFGAAPAQTNELVFQFTNPSFGGNPLNGSYLAALAEAQRTATANDAQTTANGGVGGIGGIGGPTIIIPIAPGNVGAPTVGTDAAGTEAAGVDQVAN